MKIMKTMKVLASFLVLFFAVQVGYTQCGGNSPIETVKYKVNANSDHCKTVVETALTDTDGVQSAILDLSTSIVTIKFNKNTVTKDDVANAITDKGYTATLVNTSTNNRSHKCNHPCGNH